MDKEQIPRALDNAVEIKPLKVDDRENRSDYRYDFDEIHIDDIEPDNVGIEKVRFEEAKTFDGYIWLYADKPIVFLTRESVYCKEGQEGPEARRQAYYALSVLESMGCVTGWRRL